MEALNFLSSGVHPRSCFVPAVLLTYFYIFFQVLNFTRFSSKSDVWAYGVLCWEVFTCGEMPYGRAKNPEVVERVQRGQILSQPGSCPAQVYEVGVFSSSLLGHTSKQLPQLKMVGGGNMSSWIDIENFLVPGDEAMLGDDAGGQAGLQDNQGKANWSCSRDPSGLIN